jgi:hypothetical protein
MIKLYTLSFFILCLFSTTYAQNIKAETEFLTWFCFTSFTGIVSMHINTESTSFKTGNEGLILHGLSKALQTVLLLFRKNLCCFIIFIFSYRYA